ncbi:MULTISPECIES: hypothetical protein [unclassified Roseovarius]|uniref:hypothetical protein n=1 Tax=unclassified Roseovarius TaxID=2614913 RepID=UPI00273DA5B3|nr:MULTISPECIES: hypothetical protein [unclassified Roseovarius]
MKPNFALTLSFEGIGLLHRAFPGWHLVGEIDLDNSDLLADLKMLREKAVALDPSGLRSKLVLPNDQIRYISFTAADADPDQLPSLVKQNLDGATPYDLDDLVYDWSQDGESVHVAAVARETLREAEAFAKEHRFNPICFVAIPENGSFKGEPFFGATALAAEIAENGQEVERDTAPVRVIGTARLPDPTATHAEKTEDEETEASAAPPPSQQADEEELVETGFAEPPAPFDGPDVAEVTDDPDTETPPEATPETAFSSIRAHRGDAPTTAPKLEGVARHFTPVPVSAEVVADHLPGDPDEDATPDPSTDEITPSEPELTHIPPAPPQPIHASDPAAFTTRRTAPIAAPIVAPVAASPPRAQEAFFEDEEQRMTVFGARDAAMIGGKPRYLGLILTAVLLLFLAGVAAWASIFLDDGLARFFRDDPDVTVAQVPAAPEPTGEEEAIVAALTSPSDDVNDALREALSQPKPAELTEDEARARYAATGIWLVAPEPSKAPAAETFDDFYQTSIDRDITIEDPVAVPDAATLMTDERPLSPNSPTSAGTKFTLDERGLVVATAQGALTPDGIRVFAGQPPIRPAAMPRRERVEDVIDPEAIAQPELAAFRPNSRPADLAEKIERGALSGRTRTELAALRPKLRPQSAQEAAELAAQQAAQQATQETAAATATTQPFIDLDAVNSAVTEAVQSDTGFASATPQAVASSLKPLTRPRNFDRIVRQSTESQQAVAVSAAQKVAPRIPTATSVAKQATQRNVLRLRKVNLIGVYGSPNSRRALVRLSNGRYKKVKVGDRLDGGRVSAIGDTELRYQKSGRSVVLKMPKG